VTGPTRIQVDVPTMAPDGQTAVYVVGDDARSGREGPNGRIAADKPRQTTPQEVLVVDPATATPAVEDAVAPADRVHVAVTHHHPDHVGGVAALAERFDATIWARQGRRRAFEAATGVTPDRTFLPGDELPVLDGIAVLDTPGHATEHVAFGSGDWLLTGDLVVAEGSVVVGGDEGDLRAYLTSLRRLHALNPGRLYPAHGPVIEDVRETCTRLIDHRLERERRVRRAVTEGAETPEAVLEAAYDKDLTGVRELALATVEAHLQKLDAEGRITWDGDSATTADSSGRSA